MWSRQKPAGPFWTTLMDNLPGRLTTIPEQEINLRVRKHAGRDRNKPADEFLRRGGS